MFEFRRFRHVAVLTAVLVATLLPASPVRAASIVVTTTTDEYGTGPGECSLREAVQAANTDAAFGGCSAGPAANLITLPAGTYGFSLSGAEGLPNNAIGDLDVDGTLIILGQGLVTIDANDTDRIFEVGSGDTLNLRGLTLTDGTSQSGGAIRVDSGTLSLVDVVVSQNAATGPAGAYGGGLSTTNSIVELIRSSIINNSVTSAVATDDARGGGMFAYTTTLTIRDSLISGNAAEDRGGGIDALEESSLILSNVTISSNRALDGDGMFIADPSNAVLTNVTIANNGQAVFGKGGGLYASPTDSGDLIQLQNVTLSTNLGGSQGGDGGNIYVDPSALGHVTAKNTIAAHPLAGGNCGGSPVVSTLGHNLEYGAGIGNSPCFNGDGTTVTGDPMFPLDGVGNVAPPADNGGPTPTLALGSGSAALDRAVTEFGVVTMRDQRGILRTYGTGMDIGAYERSFCQGVLVTIVGTGASETITGTAGADGILGMEGHDVIYGLGGNDGLCGNGGDDVVDGGVGNDSVDGGVNNDTLVPGPGLDRVFGGKGIDTVSYAGSNSAVTVDLRLATGFANGQGHDTINGVENVIGSRFGDTVRGSNLANLLRLGAGADKGYGYGGADRIEGGPGGDSLFGGTGNDALYGEAGNDSFNGEAGRDLCRQGAGVGRRVSCERR